MSNKWQAAMHGGAISRQCEAGRHAGGYAPQTEDGRLVGDAFQPPCSGAVPVTQQVYIGRPEYTHTHLEPCACPCHDPGAKLT